MSGPRSLWWVLVLFLSLAGSPACSPTDRDDARGSAGPEMSGSDESRTADTLVPSDPATSPETPDAITAENVFDHERAWPDIVALVDPWTPPGETVALKAGDRGALIRVEPDGQARIAFGRHGNRLIPIGFTDLIRRANEVDSGARHKIAPNFLLHFGTQFLHPTLAELVPLPTPELAKSTHFLCVFAKPSDAGFPALVERLRPFAEVADLQVLFFPLDMPQGSASRVKETLTALAWPVPFAYPQAAEVHTQKLIGPIPEAARALLITDEGRSLLELPLEAADAGETLLSAAKSAIAEG